MDIDDRRSSKLILPSRRSAMIMTGAAGIMVAQPALGALVATPAQSAGPFYPPTKPADSDADLTMVAGRSKRAEGVVIEIVGRVFDTKGNPLAAAQLEIWQADAFGAYHHPRDPNSVRVDPNFQGFAAVRTAKDGGYRFRTIKPKSYKAGTLLRTPHIHVHLMEGSTTRLVTQMYFPDEQLNKNDFLFAELTNPAERNAATARVINTGTPIQYQYDIVV